MNKDYKVGIIGVGYVGIQLVIQFAKKKIYVECYDKDYDKIKKIKSGKSPFSYINDSVFKKISKNISINKNFKSITKCDAIILCLPTPLRKNKPDLSQIKDVWNELKNFIRKNQLIILESTSYPGTTEEIFVKYLKSNFELGKNIFLAYSPERENPGDKNFEFSKIPKIVSGINEKSKLLAGRLYSKIVNKVVYVDKIKIAEMAKLLENIYRSVNIALVNELKIFSKRINIDINKVIDAAKTKPFGFQEFRPGPGVGGHCIPIDPLYLSWLAKKHSFNTKFIELASRTNIQTTKWTINQIKKIIKNKKIKKILILGIAYKKNIEDTRESSGVKIFEKLKENKEQIEYCDPFVNKYEFNINNKPVFINSKKNSENVFKKYDCFILCADHDVFNYKKLNKTNKYIIDLRARFSNEKDNKKIIYV
tara:strand:+ start:15308 stop:16573 length:1266 start_codon:yes stop_codon:yes gene_type:complete